MNVFFQFPPILRFGALFRKKKHMFEKYIHQLLRMFQDGGLGPVVSFKRYFCGFVL